MWSQFESQVCGVCAGAIAQTRANSRYSGAAYGTRPTGSVETGFTHARGAIPWPRHSKACRTRAVRFVGAEVISPDVSQPESAEKLDYHHLALNNFTVHMQQRTVAKFTALHSVCTCVAACSRG